MKIRPLTNEEFQAYYDKYAYTLFEDSLWYDVTGVYTPAEAEAFPDLRDRLKTRWTLHLGAFEADELVGWCSSFQTKPLELYMRNSVVLPDHRRRGIYTALMLETLRCAQVAAFQTVSSYHVCTNNAVIIPKLKAGFHIVGLEVWDEVGVVVRLVKHLNEVRQEALEFRSGAVKPSDRMRKVFKI
jgi:hypothetical protein